ncbi:MAG: mevalonate kinase [Candidatus Heimdallarchaeota archaeon]|nr:mevalonate kinase [Candidatus Heimdallarchaeota archaeon]MBY8993814.1 mevalonate kinase [Candidatus Heimdallarchaeota archaeon]
MTIVSSAPGKLILFGEHASSRGKPAIVFAVNSRLTVILKEHNYPNKGILLTSRDFNVQRAEYPSGRLNIVSKVIDIFFEETLLNPEQFQLIIKSRIKPGFGSSAAVIASVLGALNSYYKTNFSKRELLRLGIKANYVIKGYGSGLDIAASIYGGLIKYQIDLEPEYLPFENLDLIIGNTGKKAPSGPIVNSVKELEKSNPKETKEIFNTIESITNKAEQAIKLNDIQKIGQLMNENQEMLRKLEVSSEVIEEMIQAAIDVGATGGKISGAGIGDNIIVLGPSEKREEIIKALNKTKGRALAYIRIEQNGLMVSSEK